MENSSGIHPVGRRILVIPTEVEDKTASGIILSSVSENERSQMANTTGVVVELGEDAYTDFTEKWCSPGDKVVYAKYAGLLYLGKDGRKYRVMNDTDVAATLDADVKLVDPFLARYTN